MAISIDAHRCRTAWPIARRRFAERRDTFVDDLGSIIGNTNDPLAITVRRWRDDFDRQHRQRLVLHRGCFDLRELMLEVAELAILNASIRAQLRHLLRQFAVVLAQRLDGRGATDARERDPEYVARDRHFA